MCLTLFTLFWYTLDMKQELQLTEVTKPIKKGEKIIILELTDIQLHSNARISKSTGDVIDRSIKNNKPGRIFSPLKNQTSSTDNKMTFEIPFNMQDPSLHKMIADYQKQGYRVMIKKPTSGLPILLGKDAQEFMESKNGKRILRGIAKRKDKE